MTKDPLGSATQAAIFLRNGGYSVEVVSNLMPEVGNKFVLLKSDTFDSWVMAFRWHALIMAKPPGIRKLL